MQKSGLAKIRFPSSGKGAISNSISPLKSSYNFRQFDIWYGSLNLIILEYYFWVWMRYYLHKQKLINILILAKPWVDISFNFRARKSYYIPNYCKLYEESKELYRFALAALERELELRKRVHFFLHHPLIECLKKYQKKFF